MAPPRNRTQRPPRDVVHIASDSATDATHAPFHEKRRDVIMSHERGSLRQYCIARWLSMDSVVSRWRARNPEEVPTQRHASICRLKVWTGATNIEGCHDAVPRVSLREGDGKETLWFVGWCDEFLVNDLDAVKSCMAMRDPRSASERRRRKRRGGGAKSLRRTTLTLAGQIQKEKNLRRRRVTSSVLKKLRVESPPFISHTPYVHIRLSNPSTSLVTTLQRILLFSFLTESIAPSYVELRCHDVMILRLTPSHPAPRLGPRTLPCFVYPQFTIPALPNAALHEPSSSPPRNGRAISTPSPTARDDTSSSSQTVTGMQTIWLELMHLLENRFAEDSETQGVRNESCRGFFCPSYGPG